MLFSDSYPLKPYQSMDQDKIRKVISCFPLATLIIQQNEYPEVLQIPLILSNSETGLFALSGHVDKNNPLVEAISRESGVYCLFSGPNSYVTPAIYPDAQFPGWNYVSVHVKGSLEAIDSEQLLTELLLRTAMENEPADSGYQLRPSQKNFKRLLQHIVGFTVRVDQAHAILKLSQDKTSTNTAIARDYLVVRSRDDVTSFLEAMLA